MPAGANGGDELRSVHAPSPVSVSGVRLAVKLRPQGPDHDVIVALRRAEPGRLQARRVGDREAGRMARSAYASCPAPARCRPSSTACGSRRSRRSSPGSRRGRREPRRRGRRALRARMGRPHGANSGDRHQTQRLPRRWTIVDGRCDMEPPSAPARASASDCEVSSAIHRRSRATASSSTRRLPRGGICSTGWREAMRATSMLASGLPGAMRSTMIGGRRALEVARYGQRGRAAPAARLPAGVATVYCSTKPSDAISPAPVWHIPQLPCR